jgi:hypothetical protein
VGSLDPTRVNVRYTPGGGGTAQQLVAVPDKAHCPASGLAWYYDNLAAPIQILLCPAACSAIATDAGAQLEVLLGCPTMM